MTKLILALAQFNPIVGDIKGNVEKAITAHFEASQKGADIIAFPELFLTGYPPEDLVLKPAFQFEALEALKQVALATKEGAALLIGLPYRDEEGLFNAYAACDKGEVVAIRKKVDLPNYGVFDEKRVFDRGEDPGPVHLRGIKWGLPICEDIWGEEVVETLLETGADILLSPNGSPYWRGKHDERLQVVIKRVAETGLPLIYLNQVGGQDELVFDGASFGLNADYQLAFQMKHFEEDLAFITLEKSAGEWVIQPSTVHHPLEGDKADYAACVLGLRDYITKNRFKGVVLGLSGGIDSAICAAMAADAIGADRVHAVMMPYKYTSSESLEDAALCATRQKIRYDILPIEAPVAGFLDVLSPLFKGLKEDTTEENLQSRTRGTLLMALSNKFGTMLVTTGNKSEMSVGYCTLYGDMNGGFNPIKDLYKMEVFALCHLRNSWKPSFALGEDGEVIPARIITKPPSAELRENQKDQDSLPPYEELDAILKALVEEEKDIHSLVAEGFSLETVKKIERLLYLAEYKRRQSAPGVKVTKKNFGRDRRYPITNQYRDSGNEIPKFSEMARNQRARSEYLDF